MDEINFEKPEEQLNYLKTNFGNELSYFLQTILSKKLGAVTKTVRKAVSSGVINVPRSWIDETVIVLKLNKPGSTEVQESNENKE
jgi:hypothetical protein